MNSSRIYHGGGLGRGNGFSGGGAVPGTKYDFERVWIAANDLTPLTAFPANGPMTRSFPLTVGSRVMAFSASELDLVFAWICLPSKYWDFNFAVGCSLKLYWFNETTSANIIAWRAEMNYIRHGETCNFAPPALNNMNIAAGTQYLLNVQEYANFPINNPSGSVVNSEGAFYVKVGRDGTAAEDTYAQEAYLLGVSIDFPLTY
ncbi:MAG: hypothetical protein WC390_11890 [Sulfurimonas sp.]|jgi:hypothetical protein